jgi:hypothetical protein
MARKPKFPYKQASAFGNFPPTNVPDADIAKIRQAVTDLRNSLFRIYGVTAANYDHIIRIERKGKGGAKSASCGCGCS